MSHFDDWITERSIKLSDINEFMENLDNIDANSKGIILYSQRVALQVIPW